MFYLEAVLARGQNVVSNAGFSTHRRECGTRHGPRAGAGDRFQKASDARGESLKDMIRTASV